MKHGFKFLPARASDAGGARGQGGGEPGVPEGVVDHQAVVPEVAQGGVSHDFIVGEDLVGREHGVGKGVADPHARHAGLVGEALGDGRLGVAPVPSRGEAAACEAGEAGGLLEGEFRGHDLVDLLGARSAEGGEPGAVVGEDVGDGDGEEVAVGVFDFKLVGAVEASELGGGGHLPTPEERAGVLPCLGAVVLAFRVGSDHRRLAPFDRYSVVGDEKSVRIRLAIIALPFLVLFRSGIVFPHVRREFDVFKQRFFPRAPVQVQHGGHRLGEDGGVCRIGAVQLGGLSHLLRSHETGPHREGSQLFGTGSEFVRIFMAEDVVGGCPVGGRAGPAFQVVIILGENGGGHERVSVQVLVAVKILVFQAGVHVDGVACGLGGIQGPAFLHGKVIRFNVNTIIFGPVDGVAVEGVGHVINQGNRLSENDDFSGFQGRRITLVG